MTQWLTPTSESMSPVALDLDLSYVATNYFVPIVVVCGICLLATAA